MCARFVMWLDRIFAAPYTLQNKEIFMRTMLSFAFVVPLCFALMTGCAGRHENASPAPANSTKDANLPAPQFHCFCS